MVLKLYLHEASPVARAVLITAAAIELEIEKTFVDLVNGEQLKPEFLKVIFKFTSKNYLLCSNRYMLCFAILLLLN